MKLNYLALLLFVTLRATAFTNISTPTVSGHWTLAGSPYRVFNDVRVDSNQSITIDPGVEVVFQGPYKFDVYGTLISVGTSALPISFHIADTTGWWNSDTTLAGGWRGLRFFPYSGTGADLSGFEYCNLSYTKFDNTYGGASFACLRNMAIRHCNFFNNRVTSSIQALLNFGRADATVVSVDSCSFYSNHGGIDLFLGVNFLTVRHCKFYDNTCSVAGNSGNIIDHFGGVLTFEQNEVYQNDGVAVFVGSNIPTRAAIRGNKIHHNVNREVAAISILADNVEISGNLVCNNHQTDSNDIHCAGAQGGAAIRISGSGLVADSNLYIIRDNIIANNRAEIAASGLFIFNAYVVATNNLFINNSSPSSAVNIYNDSQSVVLRNNIFYNNTIDGFPPSFMYSVVAVGDSFLLAYDHNWTQHIYHWDVNAAIVTIAGDTTTNVIGSTPGFVAPTLTHNLSENALFADFRLLSNSAAINRGDTAGTFTDATDYAGNPRIAGSRIDIGPYEFNTHCPGIAGPPGYCLGASATLSDSLTGGHWISAAPGVATIDSITGVTHSISAGTATITYIRDVCFVTRDVTVNPLPAAIAGNPDICIHTGSFYTDSTAGGIWSSNTPAVAPVDSLTGIVSGIALGTATISYTAGGCTITKTVTVDPLPAAPTGSPAICEGATMLMADTDPGGTWGSSDTSLVVIDESTGTAQGRRHGAVLIIYTLPTGCRNFAAITVNPLPAAYNVTGGGNRCISASGLPIGVSGSEYNVEYVLHHNGMAIDSTAGTGSALSFSAQSAAGVYTVLGTYSTTGCAGNMMDSSTINVDTVLSPSVSISSFAGASIAAGQPDTLIATSTNIGATPYYQWVVNWTYQIPTTPVFVSSDFHDGDSVTCVLMATNACGNVVAEDHVIIHVRGDNVPKVTGGGMFNVYPNPSDGHFIVELQCAETTPLELTVTNVAGQTIYSSFTTSNKPVEIHLNAPPGTYFLTANGNGGKHVSVLTIER